MAATDADGAAFLGTVVSRLHHDVAESEQMARKVSGQAGTNGDRTRGQSRIETVIPGQDGQVRVADVRVGSKVFRRPIAKLCLLPIEDNSTTKRDENERRAD